MVVEWNGRTAVKWANEFLLFVTKMGDAGSSDDPLGSKSETREVETKIHSNSTPEKLILGLTIFETKRKISETFNNLEVRFLRLYKGHDFSILCHYVNVSG